MVLWVCFLREYIFPLGVSYVKFSRNSYFEFHRCGSFLMYFFCSLKKKLWHLVEFAVDH